MAEMSMNKVIHAAFRRDLGRFVSALASFPDGDRDRAAGLGRAWDNFDHQLTRHHEGEHEIAWPAMTRVGVSSDMLAQMDAEHDVMAEALGATRVAMASLRASASAADAATARAAFGRLREVTVAHLDHEEAELEPVYLAHADDPVIKDMGKKFGKVSPAEGGRFFAWLTDGAGPEERAALARDVPKAVVAIIGGVWGRSYRRDVAPVWQA